MISENEVKQQVLDVLSGNQSLDDFEDWLVSRSWNMHLDSSLIAQELVWAIELALAEYSNGHLSHQALQEQLRQSLGQTSFKQPFATARNVEAKISFGELRQQLTPQVVPRPALDLLVAVVVEIQSQGGFDSETLDLSGRQTNRILLTQVPT